MEYLNKDAEKSCTLGGGDDQINTYAQLPDVIHKSYGFSGNLLETLTNECHCNKASFSRGAYKLCCYVCVVTHGCGCIFKCVH